MGTHCTECGQEIYSKFELCRPCRKASQKIEEWDDNKHKVMGELFTKRIVKNLRNLDIEPNENDVQDMINEGHGLFLHGSAGSGKTLYACAVLLEITRRHYINHELRGVKGQFISVLNLLEEIRASYGNNKFQADDENRLMTTGEITNYYSSVNYLILDDIGAEKSTDWTVQILQMIINNRYEDLKPTIITSNFNLNELGQHNDDRLASRICEACRVKSFGDKDYRIK